MAISTPAQKPRGAARRTRSTRVSVTLRGYPYPCGMPLPRVVAVTPGSAAARAGLPPGDEMGLRGGQAPRDVIQYQLLADEPELELDVRRDGLALALTVEKGAGE